jgi:ADP-ribose pyrophosphatase
MAEDTDDPRPRAAASDRDTHLVETRVSSRCVFDGKLLHVRSDDVRLPDGHAATREYIVHPGAVLIVPVRDDGRLVVERQFRYPLNRRMIEFPAGNLEPGEDAIATAKRELVEEAGYEARAWTPLGNVHTVVSYSTEAIAFFVAEGLVPVGANLDHGEFLEVVDMSVDEMLAALDRGEITDLKTIAALLMYARRRGGGG